MSGALLVLGAGEEQVAIYREARRRGLPTIAVDMRSDRPGIPLADEFHKVSTTDHRAIAKTLAGRQIAGVVTTAADTGLKSWHELSRHFATPWTYPSAAVEASMDKSAFHRLAASLGVPTYRWSQSDNLAELATTAEDFRYPLVVKPTDASGCRGILRVDKAEDLPHALRNAAANSPRGQVIVEEFISGRDLTVNVFMANGEIGLSLITDKQIIPGPHFLIGGHVAPARLDPATESALLADAHKLCLAMDLANGPANFDVIVTPDDTRYILEVGARMSGNGFPRLAESVTGVDCVQALVSMVTGHPFDVTPTRSRPAHLHVITSPLTVPGTLVSVADPTAAELFVTPGDTVLPFTEAGRKLGWTIVSADNPDDLPTALKTTVDRLGLHIEPASPTQPTLNSTPRQKNAPTLPTGA